MLNLKIRLEHNYIFPEDKSENILDYLKRISPSLLKLCIGASNLKDQRNYHNFISDNEIQEEVIQRVNNYLQKNKLSNEVIVVTREASLRLIEIILSNRQELLDTDREVDENLQELNLLKSYLIINEELNAKQEFPSSGESFEKIVDNLILTLFPVSDLGLFEDSDLEFTKLLYTTIVKVEMLIEFLQSDKELKYLEEDLFQYFNQKSSNDFLHQMKFLFGKLLEIRHKNLFKFEVDDEKARSFLDSLIAESIVEVEDYTNLKNHPFYKIDDATYSIVDYFFTIDKFFKSVKFVLKDSYNNHHNLSSKDRSFFNFYNKDFFEKYLVKNGLDQLFHFDYYVKNLGDADNKGEPDYYVRHNNRIYLFEVKDVMIAGGIKSSADINQILKILKKKFLIDRKKQVGIGQLVRSIEEIVNNNFLFDDYVNTKKNLTIYPILLVSERIFETPGINYKLNQWYLDLVKEKLGDKYNSNFIKNLTLIDIDTIINWLPYLKKNNKNFRIIMDIHQRTMSKEKKLRKTNSEERYLEYKSNVITQLSPISNRLPKYPFPRELLSEKFKDVVSEIEDN